ncbi:hypothetical protein HDV64DRAFT_247474 [Trichoderma sp. TUCIM 5745]
MLFDGAQQPVSLALVAVFDSGSRLLGCRYKQGIAILVLVVPTWRQCGVWAHSIPQTDWIAI